MLFIKDCRSFVMEVKMSGNTKTVVIYKTKYGSAKQYAQWIAEELKCDLFEQSSFSAFKI
jgi:flavodoxin